MRSPNLDDFIYIENVVIRKQLIALGDIDEKIDIRNNFACNYLAKGVHLDLVLNRNKIRVWP